MSATATQRLVTLRREHDRHDRTAQSSIAVLRAPLTVQPRLMSDDDSQPPPMLPTSAIR